MYGRDNVELALLAVEEGMSGREAAEPAARTRKAAGGGHATDHDLSAAAPGAPAVFRQVFLSQPRHKDVSRAVTYPEPLPSPA